MKWLKEFRRAYKTARHKFERGATLRVLRGDNDVALPLAADLLERRSGVNCETTGPPLVPTA